MGAAFCCQGAVRGTVLVASLWLAYLFFSCLLLLTAAEIDLLIEKDGKVLPIEVKSGKAYKAHTALNNLMDDSNYHIEQTLVLSDANLSTDGRITYLPIYMASFIKNEEMINPVVKINAKCTRNTGTTAR